MASAGEALLALRGKRVTGSEIRSQNGFFYIINKKFIK